jgi:chromosome partition protein MukF
MMRPLSTNREPHVILAGLAREGTSLKLDNVDVCFLAGLYLRAQTDALASFEEELVIEVFEAACELADPTDNQRKRATHAIQRLREQRMLARIDASGFVRAGEYALTRLATAIVESFLDDEQLTRESLSLLTRAIISKLSEIRAEAQRAQTEEQWRADVVGPLRVTVGDLVDGIERRQRGLDSQQQDVRQQIGDLLQDNWASTLTQCEVLLDSTSATLKELNEVLMRDSSQIQMLLQSIQDSAVTGDASEAEEAAQRVSEQIDRMAAWGSSRQATWSDYYRYVHRYLRDVVRLDPDRALSRRLLEQLREWPGRPFYLLAADEGRIELLRDVVAHADRAPVRRPHVRRDRDPEPVTVDDDRIDLEDLVARALADGARDLADVTRRVLADVEDEQHYAAIGRIAGIVAKRAATSSARARPWISVNPKIEIENWSVEGSRA